MNWMDVMLYRHFNATLHRHIVEHGAAFEDDLAELRRLKAVIATDCAEWSDWSEDHHRKRMLGEMGEISDKEFKCHLQTLDSGGFVKFLKKVLGVPKLEVHRQGRPLKSYTFIPVHGTGAAAVITVFHQFALRNGLRPALPLDVEGFTYGYPGVTSLPESVAPIPAVHAHIPQPGPGRTVDGYDFLVSAPLRYNLNHDPNELVRGGPRITILQNPADHFTATWEDPEFVPRRRIWHKHGLSGHDFLKNPDPYFSVMPAEDQNRLRNGQAFDLGLSSNPSDAEVNELADRIQQKFTLVMLGDYMDESLVFVSLSISQYVLCLLLLNSRVPMYSRVRLILECCVG